MADVDFLLGPFHADLRLFNHRRVQSFCVLWSSCTERLHSSARGILLRRRWELLAFGQWRHCAVIMLYGVPGFIRQRSFPPPMPGVLGTWLTTTLAEFTVTLYFADIELGHALLWFWSLCFATSIEIQGFSTVDIYRCVSLQLLGLLSSCHVSQTGHLY